MGVVTKPAQRQRGPRDRCGPVRTGADRCGPRLFVGFGWRSPPHASEVRLQPRRVTGALVWRYAAVAVHSSLLPSTKCPQRCGGNIAWHDAARYNATMQMPLVVKGWFADGLMPAAAFGRPVQGVWARLGRAGSFKFAAPGCGFGALSVCHYFSAESTSLSVAGFARRVFVPGL